MKTHKTRRRESAMRLLVERAKRTPLQQLAVLDARGFVAKKERTRLLAQIEKESKK